MVEENNLTTKSENKPGRRAGQILRSKKEKEKKLANPKTSLVPMSRLSKYPSTRCFHFFAH